MQYIFCFEEYTYWTEWLFSFHSYSACTVLSELNTTVTWSTQYTVGTENAVHGWLHLYINNTWVHLRIIYLTNTLKWDVSHSLQPFWVAQQMSLLHLLLKHVFLHYVFIVNLLWRILLFPQLGLEFITLRHSLMLKLIWGSWTSIYE